MVVTPVMALAGVVWGALAAPTAEEVLGWIFGGALGFSALAYLYVRLEPFIAHLGQELFGSLGWVAGVLWDWVVVGGFVYLLTEVVGMPTFGAVTSAVLIGGTYALAVAWFLDEGGSRALSGFLSGSWGRPRVAFSHIETMIARGNYETAIEELESFVLSHPRDPRGWLTLGRLVDRERDDPTEALRTLREGLKVARLTVQQRHRYLVEMVRVCESCDAPERAVPELERLVEDHPDTIQAEWARTQLRSIRG